ncbi:30S ribosomal protein S15 [Candidatus Woesearchaeota archaeon]|nr:30S ribosomal protein S15 [Candidatus Woesearchaeota archaeon]
MARMHSRGKGKSGSTRPLTNNKPIWQRYGANEVELLVQKLAKQGMPTSQIGLHLRDAYGIPSVKLTCEKSVSKILKDKEMSPELPEDLFNLMKRSVIIRKHLETNHKDQPAARGLQLTHSKILRLVKYYKANKKLDRNWKFDPKKVKLFVE